MKRTGLWIIGMGLFLSMALLAAEQARADGPHCTLKTLKGRYLFGGIATLFPPATAEPALLAVGGYHIFNGDGTGTDVVSATINGQSVENQLSNPARSEYDITYTVNPDCSGTYSVPAAGGLLRPVRLARWHRADGRRRNSGLRAGAGPQPAGVPQVDRS